MGRPNKVNDFLLYLIFCSFILIKVYHLLNQSGVSWDSAVYIEMGKYLFSSGKVGLWEPARPLVWPIFLGVIWKLGLNPISFGSFLQIIFSLGCIYLTYLIGKDILKEKVALFSAFLLAFSPTFLFYSSTQMTEIPSLFFALVSIYLLMKEKHFLVGILLGISFMVRFLQLFMIIPLIFILFTYKKDKLEKVKTFSFGFSIIVIPYLILNILLYKNPLYPFILQAFMTEYTGWVFHQPVSFYFINLLKENFSVMFAMIGTILFLAKPNKKRILILGIFLIYFIFFNSIVHKEMRFVITFLPYMYLIASYGIFKSLGLIKNKKIVYSSITIVCLIILTIQITRPNIPLYKEYPEFNDYLQKEEIKEGIWISNPIFIAKTDKKVDELMYYPLYNSNKIDELKQKLSKANHILLDTCDILPCPPADKECPTQTKALLDNLKKDFKIEYQKKEQGCEQFIFKR